MGFPSLASEFPNDNSEISGGAVWVGIELTGPPSVEVARFEPVTAEPFVLWFDDEEDCVEGGVEVFGEAAVSGAGAVLGAGEEDAGAGEDERGEGEGTEEEAGAEGEAEAEAFEKFEAALVEALMAQGATRAAATVPRMLRLEAIPAEALAKEALLTLQSRGYLDGSARYSAKFRDLCGAWGAVLRGASQDFSACGTTTLDRFGAELLAALLAVPATRADELRRDLRKAGIAAFGVLQAA